MTDSETIQAINILVQGLGYMQEHTKLGKQDPNDLTSPVIPLYNYKTTALTGKLRDQIETKLSDLLAKI